MKILFNRWIGVLLLIGACVSLPVLETGCKHTFESTGYYAQAGTNGVSSSALYSTDASINAAKVTIEGFLTWEKANRTLVQSKWPDVTKYAIQLSNDAPKWLQSAVRLRDAYTANPTAENKTAFDQAMNILDQAVTEAQRYLAQGVKSR